MPAKKDINWAEELQPVIKKYGGRKYPLNYHNKYELLVMVILSAQDSTKHINDLAPAFFKAYPSLKELSNASELYKLIGGVRNFANKAKWLITLATIVGSEEKIPANLDGLTALPGVGRRSGHIIMREYGGQAEGVIVDLHVLRVVPRMGIAGGTDPKKIESRLMEEIPQKGWNEIGMALSFLGQEICRPTNPNCNECPVSKVCMYYQTELKPSRK